MCGIAGFQGDFPVGAIEAMTATLAHRGPDGHGTSILDGGSTCLGHRRLSIIDPSPAGRQPMTVLADRAGAQETGLTLVYNGEIYNFRELRVELEREGHSFHSHTDSEVLLHLYESYGLEMLSKLNGIFALAIHDARTRGRPGGVEQGSLFLARDPMGVKPLYYTQTERGLGFASELKALLRLPGIRRELDPVAVHFVLAYLWTPAPLTAMRGVAKLEPGEALLVHRGRIRRRWSYGRPPIPNGADEFPPFYQAGATLAERIARAVERQLVADVPVGAFLSGGLDSSAVVAMVRRAWPERRFPCFTISLRGDEAIEGSVQDLPYARRVAAHLSVDLEEIVLEPESILRLPELVWWLDEPQGDAAPINALMIAERARGLGVPVLLSGAGGDDVFGGYRRHWALQFERRWQWLPRQLRSLLGQTARFVAEGGLPGQDRTAVRRVAKMFTAADSAPDRRLVAYFHWSPERSRRSLYTPQFATQVRDLDTHAPLLSSLARLPGGTDRLDQMLYLEARHFLADHNLNYTDRAGMAAGVEIRVPLLDLELLQYAAGIPAAYKQRGRVGKAILKKAMEPYLPRDVIYRSKTGFGVPLRRWLRRELRSMVDDTLGPESLRNRGLFEPAAVRSLIQLNHAGRVDGSYLIFALMNIELWCRLFIDGGGAASMPETSIGV